MNGYRKHVAVIASFLLMAGCSSSEFELIPVSGTVTFSGSTMPAAEITQISFVPVANPNSAEVGQPRTATSNINPDGTFQLSTFDPGDGAVPGEYNVVLRVWKTYADRESLVPEEYTKAETTKLKAVVSSENSEFTFDVPLQ